jgi:hypothetical protein
MKMMLDDIELIKRIDKDGVIEEVRSIQNLSVNGKRRIVELNIPGSETNVFQDMGKEPIRISFNGELRGAKADSTLKELKSKIDLNKPIPFSSDITTISDVTEVVITDFIVEFKHGAPIKSQYKMILHEHKPIKGPGETKPPDQDKIAKEEVEKKVGIIFKGVQSSDE